MFLTVTRSVIKSCGEMLTDWDAIDSLVGLTLNDETGDEWEAHEALDVHDVEGFASYSAPVTDPKSFMPILEDLSPRDWRFLKASAEFADCPAAFQAAVTELIAQDDAEAANFEATEAQHAAEFRAWQDDQYGKGI